MMKSFSKPKKKNIFKKNLLMSFWIKDMHAAHVTLETEKVEFQWLQYRGFIYIICILCTAQERYMFDSLGKIHMGNHAKI